MRNEDEDNRVYKVVVNHEDQYSIWFADRENALGWNDVGKVGSRGVSRIHRGSVDRHAPVESAQAHGAVREEEKRQRGCGWRDETVGACPGSRLVLADKVHT